MQYPVNVLFLLRANVQQRKVIAILDSLFDVKILQYQQIYEYKWIVWQVSEQADEIMRWIHKATNKQLIWKTNQEKEGKYGIEI